MEDETTYNVDEPFGFLTFVLPVFKRTFNNLTAYIGDNFSPNQSIASKLGKPLLECTRHSFQLSVWEEISEDVDVIHYVIGQWNQKKMDIGVQNDRAACASRNLVHKLDERLQTNDCDLPKPRANFHFVLDVYPNLEASIQANSRAVQRAFFDSGIIRIQENQEEDLTAPENHGLQNRCRDDYADSDID